MILFVVNVMAEEEEKVAVKEIEPFLYCAVEMTGSYDQHQDAFMTLYEQAGMQGLGSDFSPFGIYFSDPSSTPVEELKWEIGFVLADSAEVKEPLKLKKWSYNHMAGILYEGSFSAPEFQAAHGELYQWVVENGYTIAGPTLEKYVDMPSQNADGEWVGKVQISIPVTK